MPHDSKIDKERIVRYITGVSALEFERLGRMAALNVVEEQKEHIPKEINIIKGEKIHYKIPITI